MNDISGDPGEDDIFEHYFNAQKHNEELRFYRNEVSSAPDPLRSRQPVPANPSRADALSFRSEFFNLGEGLQTISPGETRIVAKIVIPNNYSGVLTGFSQYFAGCEANPEIVNGVTWGIRINGLPPQGFPDFVGEFGSLMMPHPVKFFLLGGITTGNVYASPGTVMATNLQNTPTVTLQATNQLDYTIILQGRVVGYMFPVDERNDEFANF